MGYPRRRTIRDRVLDALRLLLAGTVVGLLVCVAIPILLLRNIRFVRRMKSAGRYLRWGEALERIRRHEGTLVFVDTPSHDYLTSRVDFAFWVADDLISAAPQPLPERLNINRAIGKTSKEREDAMADYARRCLNRYIDPKHGSGLLVKVPIRWTNTGEFESLPVVTISDVSFYKIPVQVYRGSITSSLCESRPKSGPGRRRK